MAWDTEATRRKLLEAGARQFAAAGYAGARIDAIGRDAGVNKERVYKYFGDKRGLFDAVLAHELAGLLDGLDIGDATPAGIGDFAGRMFDRCRNRPDLPRLLAWESLELDDAVAVETRTPFCRANADCLRVGLPGAGQEDCEQLLLSVIALVASWWTLTHLGPLVLDLGTPDHDVRRAHLVAQVTAMAQGLVRSS